MEAVSIRNQRIRKSYRDVFGAYLTRDAQFTSFGDMPIIAPYQGELPQELTLFSDRGQSKNKDSWLCFYEDDTKFIGFQKNPKKYLKSIKKFRGVISPDYSVFRTMPLLHQLWQIYDSRRVAAWLQSEGVPVIPNIRLGDERTYGLAMLGLPKQSVIALGSHGAMKDRADRLKFIQDLDHIIEILEPKTIVVYGAVLDEVFDLPRFLGIEIIPFPSKMSQVHQGGS